MADEIKLDKAKRAYATLCAALESRNWRFEKHEDVLTVRFNVVGEHLPMTIGLGIEAEGEHIVCVSILPCKIPEDKFIEASVAVCAVNYGMLNGGFKYDLGTGNITFMLNTYYAGGTVGEELFNYIIDYTCTTVNKYNYKFHMLAKGMVDINGFLKSIE